MIRVTLFKKITKFIAYPVLIVLVIYLFLVVLLGIIQQNIRHSEFSINKRFVIECDAIRTSESHYIRLTFLNVCNGNRNYTSDFAAFYSPEYGKKVKDFSYYIGIRSELFDKMLSVGFIPGKVRHLKSVFSGECFLMSWDIFFRFYRKCEKISFYGINSMVKNNEVQMIESYILEGPFGNKILTVCCTLSYEKFKYARKIEMTIDDKDVRPEIYGNFSNPKLNGVK